MMSARCSGRTRREATGKFSVLWVFPETVTLSLIPILGGPISTAPPARRTRSGLRRRQLDRQQTEPGGEGPPQPAHHAGPRDHFFA